MEHPTRAVVMACALAVLARFSPAQTPGYRLIGGLDGYTSGGVVALSQDGRIATGATSGVSIPTSGFVWSEATGRYDLWPTEHLTGNSIPAAMSNDGTILTGNSSVNRAFVWSGPGTYQVLPVLPNHNRSSGRGVSGDGSIVVGESHLNMSSNGEAFRWTQATGMQGIGYTRPGHTYSEANGISRDGNVIVGMSQDAGGRGDAFAWSAASGMRILPDLPNAMFGSAASGTNHDGSIVVGYSSLSTGLLTAVLWSGDIVQPLTAAPNVRSWATDVNDDGRVVLGVLFTNTETFLAIWTPGPGWQFPADYFAANGFPLPSGWIVTDVRALSGDGLTFGGSMRVAGLTQPFVLTIPAPATFPLVGALITLAARRRRA